MFLIETWIYFSVKLEHRWEKEKEKRESNIYTFCKINNTQRFQLHVTLNKMKVPQKNRNLFFILFTSFSEWHNSSSKLTQIVPTLNEVL